MRADDADWRGARTWSLVYSAGPEHDAVLKDAYVRYFSENGLSPSAFPSLARREREVVWSMLDLLGAGPACGGDDAHLAVKRAIDEGMPLRRIWTPRTTPSPTSAC